VKVVLLVLSRLALTKSYSMHLYLYVYEYRSGQPVTACLNRMTVSLIELGPSFVVLQSYLYTYNMPAYRLEIASSARSNCNGAMFPAE
jgi:hypothetical protein